MRCRPAESPAIDEAQREAGGVLGDCAHMRSAEVHGKEQGALLGAMLQQPATCDEGLLRNLAKTRIPVRRVNLQRMMKGVAAEQRALPPIVQLEDNMARGVAGG